MNMKNISNQITRTFYKVGFKAKKYSPEIFMAVGVAGTVVSTVMACRATTKAGTVIEEMKKDMNDVRTVAEAEREDYSEDDRKRDTVIVYAQTGLKMAKLYGPAITVGALSIASIINGHRIIRTRNVALAAAYATVDKGFKEYRSRVVERFGDEIDKELRYNIRAKEFETVVKDEKTGEETIKKETVKVANTNNYSSFARIYDDGCRGWCKDPELNMLFLRRQQDAANEMLKARGYLFLNDVYEMLGFPKTKAGFMFGWIYDEKHPVGDNFVDFGIYDVTCERTRDFVNGYERNIVLDFNVDGNIIDMM